MYAALGKYLWKILFRLQHLLQTLKYNTKKSFEKMFKIKLTIQKLALLIPIHTMHILLILLTIMFIDEKNMPYRVILFLE